ncbi:MAG TPA: hypothetical protein VIM71_10385 [Lacunisphaera sp.]
MKKLLIIISIVLSVATTGLLAQTVTAPVADESTSSETAPAKTGKHGKKKHHKHHKQAKKGHKKHKKKGKHPESSTEIVPE